MGTTAAAAAGRAGVASGGHQAVLDKVAGQSSHREGTGELAGNHREFTDSTVRPRTLQSVILVEALLCCNAMFVFTVYGKTTTAPVLCVWGIQKDRFANLANNLPK